MNNDQKKKIRRFFGRAACGKDMENSSMQQDPADLLRLLIATASISMLVIITLSTLGFYRIFRNFVINSAEEDATELCQVMIEEYRSFFFRFEKAQGMKEAMDESVHKQIDQGLRRFLKPYQIVKIKVYNTDRKIVYSTDTKIIGMVDSNNRRLDNALNGNIDSKLETKGKIKDLQDEEVINVDVVETYVPVKDRSGRLEGCFEIYLKVNKYKDHVWQGVLLAMGILVVVVLSVFSFTYILIKKGTDRLGMFQEYLKKTAVTDTLTGIANRGYLFKKGAEQFNRTKRNRKKNQPNVHMGCLMIDIDYFKSINDTRGHHVGDRIIRGVADRIHAGLRDYDLLARYGGEEFAVLLPDTDFETSRLVAVRIWNAIRNEQFPVDGENIMATVSIGISGYNDNDYDLNDMLKRADEALYKAKHGGRDRIEWV
ncbi:MAG TPA: GGDEF domain-containing protein [Dongiaceae bacterium]|nr:GGDEF domain-containing protein [Dongiaceae bacterium]